MLRAADGHGAYWTDTIGLADDHEPADGTAVLTFWQAQDKARVLVRGDNAGGDRPASVGDALDAYERDLATRGGQIANATRRPQADPLDAARPPGRPADLPRAAALARRPARRPQGVVGQPHVQIDQGRAQSGRRPRPAHRQHRGLAQALAGLPDAHTARHVGLSEPDVRKLVDAAYAVTPRLGLWAEVAATTGARPSQIARLDVADLQDERADPG